MLASGWLASDPVKVCLSKACVLGELLANHVLPLIGARQIGSVTRGDIQGLVNGWAARRIRRSTVGRMYSVTGSFSYADIDALFRKIKAPEAPNWSTATS